MGLLRCTFTGHLFAVNFGRCGWPHPSHNHSRPAFQPFKTLKTLKTLKTKTMKLPAAPAPSTEFKNALGSTVPKEFALEARKNPDVIKDMAETPSEKCELEKEALARQYCLVCDMSGSMSWPDGSTTRWESARKAVEKLVEVMFKFDTDGSVPLYLFDDKVEFVGECVNSGQVVEVFDKYKPRGTTDLAQCLDAVVEKYVGKNRTNFALVPGTTIVVILDGSTDSNEAVKNLIRKVADPANGYIENHSNVGFSFIQIGDDPGATAFLKELDDGLVGRPDVCDTKKDNELFAPGGVERVLRDAIFD